MIPLLLICMLTSCDVSAMTQTAGRFGALGSVLKAADGGTRIRDDDSSSLLSSLLLSSVGVELLLPIADVFNSPTRLIPCAGAVGGIGFFIFELLTLTTHFLTL